MDEMTHERCSELLGEHVRGELPRDAADAVRAHLAECAECRAEERAVAALAGEAAGLDDVERARLHRALAQELFPPRANAEVAGASGDAPWRRWIAPALGSAAAVLIALLVITGGGIMGSGDDAGMGTAGSGQTVKESVEDSAADQFEGDGGTGGGAEPKASRGKLSAAAGEAGTYNADGPQPEFNAGAGELTPEELASIGRRSPLFQSFANRYDVGDVGQLRKPFLRRLVGSAGAASDQARQCAATLPEEEPILPAYGATGTYDGRDALVLGFVTNDAGSASLDRYLMWVWAKGSCKQPVDTLFDRIER